MDNVILCIDDDQEDLDLFEEAIAEIKLPFSCVKVLSGTEGLAYLESTLPLPGIIFLDINMPAMNGVEVLKSIRALPHLDGVPVVMFSTNISNQKSLEQEGAMACIPKPGNFLDLCTTLKEFLQRKCPMFDLTEKHPGTL